MGLDGWRCLEVGEGGGGGLCSGADPVLTKGWVVGQSFCLSRQPLLNLIKALLTHHNKSDRPLGASAFQFHLQKQ